MAKQIAEMLVESTVMETPETKSVRLRWPEGYDVEFKTGQFITLYWPHTPHYKRAYSLSSCALDRGYYEVTVQREGHMGSNLVDWAEVGHVLCVIPPAGRFIPVFEPTKHLLCLAGGSGVTPFRGFVREAMLRGLTTRITVIYSVQQPEDIVFRKAFEQMAAQNPNFKFLVTCTRLAEGTEWSGHCGRINKDLIQAQMSDPANTIVYACGSNPMVQTMEHLVVHELGLPKEQMKTEKWG